MAKSNSTSKPIKKTEGCHCGETKEPKQSTKSKAKNCGGNKSVDCK